MNEAVRFLSQVFLTSKLVLKCRMRVQEKKEKKKIKVGGWAGLILSKLT